MKTDSNINRRARSAGNTAAGRASAPYRGAAERRAVRPGQSEVNPGGGFMQRRAFPLEGALRRDHSRIQS